MEIISFRHEILFKSIYKLYTVKKLYIRMKKILHLVIETSIELYTGINMISFQTKTLSLKT